MIQCSCPECDYTYKIADELAGKTVLCPECQTRLKVPPVQGSTQGRKRRDERDYDHEAEANVRQCPFCSETIMATARKCKHCGEILDPELRESREPGKGSVQTHRALGGKFEAVGFLGILAGIGICFYSGLVGAIVISIGFVIFLIGRFL